MVTESIICPKSARRNRSMTCNASLLGRPFAVSIQPPSRKPRESTTNVIHTRRRTPVREDLTEDHSHQSLVDDGRDSGRLQDLERSTAEIDSGHSGRQAITVRVVDVVAAHALPGNSLRPRGHLNSLGGQILGEVEVVALNKQRLPS